MDVGMDKTKREIVVKGTGKASVTPDLVSIQMNLEVRAADYATTIRRGTDLLDKLREAVKTAGHDGKELKTSSFYINTYYERSNENNTWVQRFAGYICKYALKLEFDLDMQKLGATLSAIAGSEANPDFNIIFTVKDADAVSRQLLESAVESARSNAEILAAAAGLKLGEIVRIDYSWSEIQMRSNTEMRMEQPVMYRADAGTLAVDIEPEDINLKDSATVVWAIE
jgi:hypothetical protein